MYFLHKSNKSLLFYWVGESKCFVFNRTLCDGFLWYTRKWNFFQHYGSLLSVTNTKQGQTVRQTWWLIIYNLVRQSCISFLAWLTYWLGNSGHSYYRVTLLAHSYSQSANSWLHSKSVDYLINAWASLRSTGGCLMSSTSTAHPCPPDPAAHYEFIRVNLLTKHIVWPRPQQSFRFNMESVSLKDGKLPSGIFNTHRG